MGAYTVDLEPRGDERGFFARFYCEKEFAEKGLASRFVQINNSLSSHRGTLRGMHYQLPPFGEVKLVRCVRGSVYDVIVDLRPKSATYLQWFGADLTAENRKMMYVPAGFAHGYLTTSEDAELLYLVSAFYAPEFERGLRHDDPAIGIKWPIEPQIISEKDKLHRDFSPDYHLNSELKDLKV
jgi:dTDP-4-dehydrorhamnose 3,5-epimerase